MMACPCSLLVKPRADWPVGILATHAEVVIEDWLNTPIEDRAGPSPTDTLLFGPSKVLISVYNQAKEEVSI
jgi:hypothetical protein